MKTAIVWVLAAGAALAQNVPHLGYVLPAGGQRGAAVEVKLGGQFLVNTARILVSGRGVDATAGEHARPMNPMQATQLRERMQELQKLPANDAVRQEMVEIRGKLLLFSRARQTSPVLSETLAARISIAPDAEPGPYEVRVLTPQGLSNPLLFTVGDLPEVAETEKVEVGGGSLPNQVRILEPPTDMEIALPVVVNGRIKPRAGSPQQQSRQAPFTPGEADRYRFRLRQGEELVAQVSARELMPYLADAVPGWFQAVLTLFDPDGKEVAFNDDFRFNPDPLLHYKAPQEGEYALEIRDAIYRGREDFVYRIRLGELPLATSVFPLGGRAGVRTPVTISGWNLRSTKLVVDAAKESRVAGLPFAAGTLPETTEKEPNDSRARAARIRLPVILNGRIAAPGDIDTFAFEGRAGQEVVAEVTARRLGSPLDSVLTLTDAAGRQLALNDDSDDAGAGLETHHADSRILVRLPAKGTYFLSVRDAQQKSGGEYAYRLRIGPPLPDFELLAAPSAINAGAGMTAPLTVQAVRKDGFAGEITVALKDAPPGFVLSGGVIPAGKDRAQVTLTVPVQAPPQPLSLKLEARALVDGREVRHPAVPADEMMQAFAYLHMVPAQDLKVAVRRAPALRIPIRITSGNSVRIPMGGTAAVRVQIPLPPNGQIAGLKFELSDAPEGVAIRETTRVGNMTDILLECDAAKAKPGASGNLVLTVSGERAANRQRVPMGVTPAVALLVVP